jgi:hypothetical protein
LRELAQRERRRERGIAEEAAKPGVRLLAAASRGEEPADDVGQRERARELRRVDAELRGELLRDPFVEEARSRVGVDLQELRPDDRDAPALLDVV